MLATVNDIYLGIAQIIHAHNPDIRLLLQSAPSPDFDNAQEWLTFELLNMIGMPSRKAYANERIMFQLGCYTVDATYRDDKKISRHYELADEYYQLLNQKDYVIKTTCVRLTECKIVYLDLKSSSDFAKAIYQNSPPMQTQSAVILVDAIVINER